MFRVAVCDGRWVSAAAAGALTDKLLISASQHQVCKYKTQNPNLKTTVLEFRQSLILGPIDEVEEPQTLPQTFKIQLEAAGVSNRRHKTFLLACQFGFFHAV